MQALSRQLANDLQARFQGLLNQDAAEPSELAESVDTGALRGSLPASATPENVVRPVVFQREPGAPRARSRPDVAGAVETVVKAAEVLRAAEQDAEAKTQRALDLASRTITQLEKCEEQLRAAQARIEELGDSAEQARTANARLAVVEKALASSQDRVRDLEDEGAHLKVALSAAETRADSASQRAASAEALAAEAEADVRYLADKVSEVLGVRA